MCVDYRDLNNDCSKCDFPLPNIDVIVDNTASTTLKYFVDGLAGYNKIKMHPDHKEKTAFITPSEVYMNDMIITSEGRDDHVPMLRKLLERLRRK